MIAGCQQELVSSKAQKSYEKGSVALEKMRGLSLKIGHPFQSGTLWNLQQIAEINSDSSYRQIVEDMKNISTEDSLRLIDHSFAKVRLPISPGRGLMRFSHFVKAPFGEPESRARVFITMFLTKPGTGYVLTHQLLAIEWAHQQGLRLPKELIAKKSGLMLLIEAELDADPTFSDLYAERTGILLLFGDIEQAKAEEWVKVIVKAQKQDGGWGSFSKKIIFDGQTFVSPKADPSHTLSWAMLSLAKYIALYPPN